MPNYPTAASALRAALVVLDAIQSERLKPEDVIDVTSAIGRQIARAQPEWAERYELLRETSAAGGVTDVGEVLLAQFVIRTLYAVEGRRAA